MKYRKLGKTGWDVSEIGFGGWGIGGSWWGEVNDVQSLDALRVANEAGINFFDTAYVYGDGHSESLMKKALTGRNVRIATKIPPKNHRWPPRSGDPLTVAFPREWIVSCTERSLRYLGRETIDLTQFHVWTDEWLQNDEWKEAIFKLKRDGKIHAFGVSINNHSPDSALKLVESGLTDTVQVIFNIFDQSPIEKLFPLCEKNNVGVIARVPLDEGGLTGEFTKATKFKAGDFRNDYFGGDRLAQTVDRARRLKEFVSGDIRSLADLALKFILAHSAVSVVIPGMRRKKHVVLSAAASGDPPLARDIKDALHAHAWPRDFYSDS